MALVSLNISSRSCQGTCNLTTCSSASATHNALMAIAATPIPTTVVMDQLLIPDDPVLGAAIDGDDIAPVPEAAELIVGLP